jgi:protoheme IX farnesyltransferase
MKTGAVSVFRGQLGLHALRTDRIADFVLLMKPRVTLLVVFSAFVGLIVAPVHLDAFKKCRRYLGIAAGAGAAGANMWYDADTDAVMARICGAVT